MTMPATVDEALRVAADEHGALEAYVEPFTEQDGPGRRSLTFAEWNRAADGVAGVFYDRGIRRGDVVAILLTSSIEYATAYAATVRLGAIATGLNPRLGPAEVDSVMRRTNPAVIVASPPRLQQVSSAGTASVIEAGEIQAARSSGPPAHLPKLHEDDPVAVVWTSGTTGMPKGAVFDHRNLQAVAMGTDVLSHLRDRRLSPLPFAHVGYMTRIWDEIEHRITTVITPTPWRASDALAIIADERVTVAQGVPAQWRLILDLAELEDTDLGSLRVVATGAARVPETLVLELRQRLGVPVVVRYTSTEASLGTGTKLDDPDTVVATTVGRPVPGVELKLVDDAGRTMDENQVGRVCLRSGAVMRGYWRDVADQAADVAKTEGGAARAARAPSAARAARAGGRPRPSAVIDRDATARVLTPDGWLVTGDFGQRDVHGNLRLVGRDNEMYIRGGYNVFPAEVEETLLAHPAITHAAVIGAPDEVLGEVGVAFVVPAHVDGEPSLEEIREHCARMLADYKAPDALVWMATLPLTPMMKVDRGALLEPAKQAAAARRVIRS